MTRYVLDTNIISNSLKLSPSDDLRAWMVGQRDRDMFIASMTIAEIWRGVLQLPAGRKRVALEAWFDSTDGPLWWFAGRILTFDEAAALVWARLIAEGRQAGRQRSELDTIIAAVAVANGCVVVTDNERDFWGLEIVNPMRASSAEKGGF